MEGNCWSKQQFSNSEGTKKFHKQPISSRKLVDVRRYFHGRKYILFLSEPQRKFVHF